MLTATLRLLGEARRLYGDGLTVCKCGPINGRLPWGLVCLFRVGMKTKGWLGVDLDIKEGHNYM